MFEVKNNSISHIKIAHKNAETDSVSPTLHFPSFYT